VAGLEPAAAAAAHAVTGSASVLPLLGQSYLTLDAASCNKQGTQHLLRASHQRCRVCVCVLGNSQQDLRRRLEVGALHGGCGRMNQRASAWCTAAEPTNPLHTRTVCTACTHSTLERQDCQAQHRGAAGANSSLKRVCTHSSSNAPVAAAAHPHKKTAQHLFVPLRAPTLGQHPSSPNTRQT
jgi:hypothetical protein